MRPGYAAVVPGRGEKRETVRLLLSLAEHASDVQTQGNGSYYLVPEALAERYERAVQETRERRPRTTKENES